MIIIEGPDLAGKTTLCKELVKRIPGSIYQHLSRLPEDFDVYHGHVGLMPMGHPRVIQDRLYMSEVAYGNVCRGSTKIDTETYRLLDAHARLVGAVHVLLLPDSATIKERWRENEMYDLNTVLKVCDEYERIATLPAVDIDFIDPQSIDDIVDLWYQRRRRVFGGPND